MNSNTIQTVGRATFAVGIALAGTGFGLSFWPTIAKAATDS